MKLPVWATADKDGYSAYPVALRGSGSSIVHVADPQTWHLALCGASGERRDYLGRAEDRPDGLPARVRVCLECRRVAKDRTDLR